MRKYYLDNLRWITVAIVVVYHAIYIFNAETGYVLPAFSKTQYQDIFQYLVYPWFMVLLFIIAGMCSRCYLEKHSIKEFIASRTKKLLVPSTLGLLVTGLAQGYISMTISGAFENIPDDVPAPIKYVIMMLSGSGVMWFIRLLWLLSFIPAIIRKFEKGKLYDLCGKANIIVLMLLAIPVWLSGFVLNAPMIVVYRFGIYGFTFMLGYFVFAHEEVIDRLSRHSIWLCAVAAVLGGVNAFLHFGENFAVMPAVNAISAVAYQWAACLALLGAMKRWGNKQTKFTAYMTKRSFGLYLFHYLPLSAAALYLRTYTQLPPVLIYICVTIAGFAGAWVLYETFSRIPVIRWITLGIGGKKKKSEKAAVKAE